MTEASATDDQEQAKLARAIRFLQVGERRAEQVGDTKRATAMREALNRLNTWDPVLFEAILRGIGGFRQRIRRIVLQAERPNVPLLRLRAVRLLEQAGELGHAARIRQRDKADDIGHAAMRLQHRVDTRGGDLLAQTAFDAVMDLADAIGCSKRAEHMVEHDRQRKARRAAERVAIRSDTT